jgi:hypothetical protein
LLGVRAQGIDSLGRVQRVAHAPRVDIAAEPAEHAFAQFDGVVRHVHDREDVTVRIDRALAQSALLQAVHLAVLHPAVSANRPRVRIGAFFRVHVGTADDLDLAQEHLAGFGRKTANPPRLTRDAATVQVVVHLGD